jgi:hypothetical protein
MQGDPGSERVSAAIVDSPPLDFAIQVPLQFIRTKQPRITWDPAPNALGRVRYTIQVGKRVYARGGSYRVVVKVRDRVGNRATVKRRVRIP